jgi:hypothetical protein
MLFYIDKEQVKTLQVFINEHIVVILFLSVYIFINNFQIDWNILNNIFKIFFFKKEPCRLKNL